MADNLTLSIGFDLQKAVEEAGQQWDKKYAKKLEDYINKRPIKVKLDFESLTDVKTRLAQLKIEPITPETKASIKELARELQVLAKALEQVQKYSSRSAGIAEVRGAKVSEIEAKASAARELARQRAAKAEQAELKLAAARERSAAAANKATTAVNNLTKAYGNQTYYIERLLKKMVAVWSIQQVQNFLTNIREVTAQFELQRVSLGAIIQDTNKASQLFSEIKTFALKSPVSIMDLTKYTKQVAAYGFETEKLFDTTKMLADISVGLGSDMSRATLFFGQVFATGHLRAAELRQATELGIPLVDKLAKKLEELNGRGYTAAEVMDLISKRAISFELVEQVFKDMTSAGGQFYNIQEKQGNTLFGLWAKLGDAASVMYDEIGNTESVNSGMKTAIGLLTELMRNWKAVAKTAQWVIVPNAALLALYKYSTATQRVDAAQSAAAAATERRKAAVLQLSAAIEKGSVDDINAANAALQKAKADEVAAQKATTRMGLLKSGFVSVAKSIGAGLGIGLIIGAVTTLAYKLFEAYENAHRLDRKLNEIDAERITLASQSVRNFEYLADVAAKAADGSKKQKDALDELRRTYKEMIPVQDLTIEHLRQLREGTNNASEAYKSLTTAIREYISEQQKQKKLSAIEEEYGSTITDKYKKLYSELTKGVRINVGGSKIKSWVELQFSPEEFERAMVEFEKRATDKTKSVGQKIKESFAAIGFDLTPDQINALQKVGKWGEFDDGYFITLNEALEEQAERINAVHTGYAGFVGDLGKYGAEMSRIADVMENKIYKANGKVLESNSFLRKQMQSNAWIKEWTNSLKTNLSSAGVEIKNEWFNLIERLNPSDPNAISSINFDAILEALNTDAIRKKLGEHYEQTKNYVLEIQKEYQDLVPQNRTVAVLRAKLSSISQATGVSMDKLQHYWMNADESIEDYAKRIKGTIEDLQKTILEMQQVNADKEAMKPGSLLLKGYSEEEIKQANALLLALQQLFAGLKGFTKGSGGSGRQSDPRLQNLKEEISLTKKLYDEYHKLEKQIGATKAAEKIQQIYSNTIKTLQDRATAYKFDFKLPFTDENLKANMQHFIDKMKELQGLKDKKGKPLFPNIGKEIDEAVAQLEDVDLNSLQKALEKKLKALADRISRTKTAKEFYEKILRLTRNEGLAFQATFSVYGKDTLDTFTDEVEQLKQNFGEIDITAAINLKTKQIDYKKLRDIWDADKSLPDNLRKIPQAYDSAIKSILDAGDKLSERQLERWGKDLERAREYADKRIELAQYTATQIAEIEAKRDSLDPESKNYTAQVAMYDKMISGYREREKNEAAKLDYEQIKEQIGMFDDLGVRIGTAFESILTQLREYTKSPDFARLGLEAQKNVYQQIAKIEDRIAEGFQGIGVGTVSEYVRQYSTAASEYLTAQNNLRDATLRAIEADKEWERVKESNDEAAKTAAWAEKQLADSRVRTAAASVNAAGANLQRAQEGAARASAKFDSNLQKVESSLKSLNNGALKALWDLIGDKGKRSVGEFLSGSRKILSALDKLTKALADSGSDMGQLSTTIATNLATALQNINPDDAEAIARAATESLKTTLSSVISDKGVVDLLANTLSKNIGEIASQALSGVLSTEDAANKVGALIDGIADAASKTGEMWGAIISLVLSLLDEFAENGIGTFLGELLDNIADAVEGILANLLTDSLPKIIGSVGNVVKGVGTGLADLLTFGAFDLTGAKRIKRANKEIKRQQELLEQLEYTYGRLEKAADSLFGADYISNYNAQMKNLQAQQTAYLRMAEAERSKGKDADDAKIAEYTNAARDAADKIQDMRNELTSKFLGTDRASAAREFAESWLEAKATFASTTDAIQSKYKDMLKSMIVEGAAAKVIDNILAPMWDNMNAMLKKSNIQGAMDYLASNMDGFLQAADSGLNALWATLEARGYDMQKLLGETSDGPTGIAHDIATASEESINGLAAGINTQNFYIAQQLQEVQRIRAIVEAGLQGSGKPSDSSNLLLMQEQAMNHYAAIEANTAATVARLDSVVRMLEGVITPRGTKGARGIQVWT